MLSVTLTVLMVALPLGQFLLTRSVARTALLLGAMLAIFGGFIQASVGWGLAWTLRSLQWSVVAVLLAGLLIGWWRDRGNRRARPSMRTQVLATMIPLVVIAGTFLAFRLLAGSSVTPLAGVGYLANHPYAEDNAKWLNLASILVSGRDLEYSGGYAGGPYILVLVVTATIWDALSFLLLGGTNEVAVTAGAVIGGGFLLAALAPLAMSPLLLTAGKHARAIPGPLLWSGVLVLVTASTAVSALGHHSLQLALLMLVLFATVFLSGSRSMLDKTFGAALGVMAAVVWFPLNLFAVAVLGVAIAWILVAIVRASRQGRPVPWPALAVLVLTALAAWDGVLSSTLYVLGLDGRNQVTASSGPLLGAAVRADTTSLFDSPGGTESATALLGAAAIAAAIAAAVFLANSGRSQRQVSISMLPLGGLALYSTAIALADGSLTGEGTNYATQKMVFTATVVILSAALPFALMNLDRLASTMTPLRWIGLVSVVFLLTLDSLLPRAIGTVNSELWRFDPDDPPYWSIFEARATADQPISQLPIACVFLPPGAEEPSGHLDGPTAYNCTRLLIGLKGAEGNVGSVMDWIRADWFANGPLWEFWYPPLSDAPKDVKAQRFALLDSSAEVIGFDTLEGLLNRFPVATDGSDPGN